MTHEPRPSNLAPDAVWPSRVKPRERPVVVNPGVTLTREVVPSPAVVPLNALHRYHPDVRSGLVDPDTGTVPPPPDNTNARPPDPTTLDVRPATRAVETPDDDDAPPPRPRRTRKTAQAKK